MTGTVNMLLAEHLGGRYLLTIKSGGQTGQPALGTIIFLGTVVVDNTNKIVGIYETSSPTTNLLLAMNHPVFTGANNIYPINGYGVNFKSQTLSNGLVRTNSSFNLLGLYDGTFYLYQAGIIPNAYYQITLG